jgi:glyoxylate reductase
MAKPKVLVTRRIPSPGIELIGQWCDVSVHEGEELLGREELIRQVADKDGLVCIPSDRVDGRVLDAAPKLKVISTFSVGYDHLDVARATRRGVFIGYTPGVLTDATADHAFALLMSAARRIVEGDRYTRAGKWIAPLPPLLGESVWGATIGIVGLGRIGRAVAARAGGFHMSVLYYDVERLSAEEEKALSVAYRPLEDLLRESDFVSIHAPHTADTRHLINEERLRLMKRTAFLVNTSRGSLVDEGALARALTERWISGAGIDVYEKEPLAPDSPLMGLDNVTLSPHLGSATRTARMRMAELTAQNLLAVLRGEPPVHWLNPEAARVRPLSSVKMLE